MAKGIDLNSSTPLYEQIVDDLRAQIRSGDLPPGAQIDTQQKLAKRYSVSLITVKNALSLLVKEGLLFTRVGRGTYVVEKTKQRASLAPHRTIGLVLRDLKHPFFSLIVHSVEERAYELGFNLLVSSSSGRVEKEESQIKHFRAMGVDGLVIASLSLEYRATSYIAELHRANFPYVMVSYIHDPEYWFVGSDPEYGAYIATEHLIKLGYPSIGYVHVGKGNLLAEIRKNGYYRAMTDHGIPFHNDHVIMLGSTVAEAGKDRFELGYHFGKEFRKRHNPPRALFFYNDIIALGFLQAAREENIRVPEDVAIVGYDDASIAQYAPIPLTTVHQPVDQIGHRAVDVIAKRLNKEDIGNRTIFLPTIIVRDSCGARRPGHSLPGSSKGNAA